MARKSKSQESGTDSVEQTSRNLWLQAHQGQREKGRRQGILLERSVVWIFAGEQPLRKMQGPAEISGVLMKVLHQEPAEDAAGQADSRRNCDAQLHEEFFRA
jgi:hypothetical protein